MTTNLSNRKWWVLTACSCSLAMIFLDQSALPIALPSIQRELNFSAGLLNWVMNAYMLAMAVLIVLGGKLGDKFGHRNLFLSGMLVFIASSILCAAAPSAAWLIVGRVMQGVGAAFMMPSSSPLLRTIIGPGDFGRMAGLYVAIASIFLIIGPSLGGFFTAYLSWRWIFWINFPVAVFAALIVICVIPKDITGKAPATGFDWRGFLTLTLGIMALVYVLMQGQALGWGSVTALSCIAVSIAAFLLFIYVEKRQQHPFIDLAMFKDDCFTRCVAIISALQIVFMSIIFWAMFLQYSLSLSPQKTGILLLAAQIPVLFSSPLAGRLLDRYGPKWQVSLGSLMISMASLWIAVFCWQHNFWWLFPALVTFGLASPMVNIGTITTVISSAQPEKRGIASGIISLARQVGGSVGLAILVAIISNVTYYNMSHWLAQAGGVLTQLNVTDLNGLLAGQALPVAGLTKAQIQQAHTAAVNAYTLAFSCGMFMVALVAFLGFLAATKLPSKQNNLVESSPILEETTHG